MIDEENVNQAIFDYADRKYGKRSKELFQKYLVEFPEGDWELPEETWRNNFLAWLLFEKILPETGMTIAEEFMANTPGLSIQMKDKILHMKNIIRSEFIVYSKKGQFIMVKDRAEDKRYKVKLRNVSSVSVNSIIKGRIYPCGDHYRFAGVFQTLASPFILDPDILLNAYENNQLKKIESILLRRNTTFRSILNKYPYHWIDWMCEHYGLIARLKKDKIKMIVNKIVNDLPEIIDGLPAKARQAWRLCLENEGFVKYRVLKDFDDDMDLFWEGKTSGSTIGLLRQRGLLVVGKMFFGDRRYKVAFVPNEIRQVYESE